MSAPRKIYWTRSLDDVSDGYQDIAVVVTETLFHHILLLVQKQIKREQRRRQKRYFFIDQSLSLRHYYKNGDFWRQMCRTHFLHMGIYVIWCGEDDDRHIHPDFRVRFWKSSLQQYHHELHRLVCKPGNWGSVLCNDLQKLLLGYFT
jgi:hypothetical protein